MMLGQGGPGKVFVAARPVDLRKGIDGLAVQEMFRLDPFCGAVFVFRATRADRIRLLVWVQTGWCWVTSGRRQVRLVFTSKNGDFVVRFGPWIPAHEDTFLKARLAAVEAALVEVREASRRLEDVLRALQRAQFGKSSEKLSPDQFNLPPEDAELAQGVLEAAQEKAETALQRVRGDTPRNRALQCCDVVAARRQVHSPTMKSELASQGVLNIF